LTIAFDSTDWHDGRMRALLPEHQRQAHLHAHYARDWVDSGGIRANMVAGVDGAAVANGLSRGLQTPGDNRVFAALRDLADVVLVGSVTAQAEGYLPARFDEARRGVRREYGFRAGLPIALVSRGLHLDPSGPLFADPANRPIVVTCASADTTLVAPLADVLVCGADEIDFGEVRRQFAARGLTRILCEGGPTLLGRIVDAGELDELCLSITPLLTGPSAPRIVDGLPWHDARHGVRIGGLLEEDDAIFVRYLLDRTG
jgi:riboflavin biosynthesis pyrimidine reductase